MCLTLIQMKVLITILLIGFFLFYILEVKPLLEKKN